MSSDLASDELVRLLLAHDDEHAIIFLNVAGEIVAWLGGAERVFGYSASEVMGRPSSVLFPPEDVEKQIPQFEMDVARSNRYAEDDRWMLRKDGQRFWATGILVPLRAATGELIGFGKVLRNRTDLKSRLEWLESHLGSQEKANERKNIFISTLAHEIRNPLAAVSSALDVLDHIGSQGDDSVFARSTIRRQLDFMQRLVEDLLEMARLGAGKIPIKKQQVRLNDIILAAVEVCRPAIDQRTHNFELVITNAEILVEADTDRLKQVFVNLIQNAAKYTAYGGNIWVKVSVEGPDAVVKVEDTGVGISPEMMPQVFDLFTQSEFDAQEARPGLGLGLSVVRDLVNLHGGTVQVRSDGIGHGSEFTVRLPLSGPDADRPDNPEGRSEKNETNTRP